MSIGSLLSLYFRTKAYLFKEQLQVAFRFYTNFRFFLFDLLFFLFYLPFNPYRICRACAKKTEDEVYGETPLSSYASIAKECGVSTSDVFFELGAGRGRGAFWLSFFIGCKVVAIERVALFVRIGRILAHFFQQKNLCFSQEDFAHTDLSKASVIYLYGTCLGEKEILHLIHKFSRLMPKTQIVTISFSLLDYAKDSFILRKSFSLSFPWGKTKAFVQTPTCSQRGDEI